MSIPSFLFRTMRVYGRMLPKRMSGLGKVAAVGRETTREVGAAVACVWAMGAGALFVPTISTKSSCVAGVVGS